MTNKIILRKTYMYKSDIKLGKYIHKDTNHIYYALMVSKNGYIVLCNTRDEIIVKSRDEFIETLDYIGPDEHLLGRLNNCATEF